MGIEKVADRGSTQNNTSETSTLVDLAAGGSVAVGNYLIARVTGDNSGTSGVARTLTITDPRSNTWTILGPANRTAGVASDGASTWICYAKVANAYTNGDDITFNYSGAIVAKGVLVEEWRGIHATSPVAVASTTATGSSTTPSISRTPVGVGQMFYSALGIEGLAADTYTQDTDVVDGSWRTLTSITGGDAVTAATSITCRGAYKITGTAAQTWNPTITSRDWSQVALVFAPAWPAGVKGAHSVSADSSITTLSATVPETTVTGDPAIAYVSYVATTQDCPTPTGWTLLDTQTPGSASARLYKKIMTTAEAGTALTFTNTTGQRLACGVVVLDGTLYSDVDVFTGAEETASTATHASPTSPALTVAGIELAVFTERSSTPSVTVAAPAGTSELSFSFGLGSGSTGGAFAIDTTPVAAGATVGGGNWVASVANAACAMWTLAIKAAQVTGSLATSGSGVLALGGTPAVTGSLALSGDGGLALAGTPSVPGALTLSGAGALAEAGTPSATGTLTLSGAGTQGDGGTPTIPGAVALTGGGSLTSAGQPTLPGDLPLSGGGTLDLLGVPAAAGSLDLSGLGELLSDGTPAFMQDLVLAGAGLLGLDGAAVEPAGPVIPGHLVASVSQSLTADATFAVLTASTEPTSRLEASDGV